MLPLAPAEAKTPRMPSHSERVPEPRPEPQQRLPERVPEELIVRLEGVFDGASAWDLRRSLEQIRGSEVRRVVLDFSRVRDFYDFGVAVLAHGLAHGGALPRVILRGLRTHQLRLFRYFGVDTDQQPPDPEST